MEIKFKDYRLLNILEHKQLLEIRNLDYVRNVSSDNKFLNLEEHMNWVNKLNKDLYFVVFFNGDLLGGVNLLKKIEKNFWGIFFTNETSAILTSICVFNFLDFAFSKTDLLNSAVLKTNKVALSYDANFGFKRTGEDEKQVYFNQSLNQWQAFKSRKLAKKLEQLSKSYKISFEIQNQKI